MGKMDIDILTVILVLMTILCTMGETFSQEIKIPSQSNIFGDDTPILVIEGKFFPDILGALNDVGKAFEDAAKATANALKNLGKDIGGLFGTSRQPNTKNYPRDNTAENKSMVKMISMYPPLKTLEDPNRKTLQGWKYSDACSGQQSLAYRTSEEICDHYHGTINIDTPNGVSVCNTGWKCEGYNYMGKRIDGTCNRDSAHKTQFQMTCDDDGSLGITEATPYWQIYNTKNKVWMKLQHPDANVLRKMNRGHDGSQDNDTRVVIRNEDGKPLNFGELKPYTPYFIQSFVNKAAWLGCNSPSMFSNKVTLKSVSKLEAKKWEFTGGMDSKIKLSGYSGYYIRAGTSELGNKWYAKESTSGAISFNVWHAKNWDFEKISAAAQSLRPRSNISLSGLSAKFRTPKNGGFEKISRGLRKNIRGT